MRRAATAASAAVRERRRATARCAGNATASRQHGGDEPRREPDRDEPRREPVGAAREREQAEPAQRHEVHDAAGELAAPGEGPRRAGRAARPGATAAPRRRAARARTTSAAIASSAWTTTAASNALRRRDRGPSRREERVHRARRGRRRRRRPASTAVVEAPPSATSSSTDRARSRRRRVGAGARAARSRRRAAPARARRGGRGTRRSRRGARSVPSPSVATVSTIGGRQPSSRPGAEVEHLVEVAARLGRAGAVRLVHDEEVGDLEEARLGGLHRVAPARGDDDDGGVGGRGDLELDLADPDGLDEHELEADRAEHRERVGDRDREAAEVAPRRERADEHARVEGVVLHPDAVAEDRPAAERRRRVDAQHAELADVRAVRRRSARAMPVTSRSVSVDLPAPGGAGDPDRERARRRPRRRRDARARRAASFSTALSSLASATRSPRARGGEQLGRGLRAPSHALHVGAEASAACRPGPRSRGRRARRWSTSVSPSATRPASTRAAPARTSVARTAAPVSRSTPRITTWWPSVDDLGAQALELLDVAEPARRRGSR